VANVARSHVGELELRAGELLRRLVDRISHRSGAALALMARAEVTLPQLLLLARVERLGTATPSAVAEASGASLPAVSQMIERLVKQGLLARSEHAGDRRRRTLAVPPRGKRLLAQVGRRAPPSSARAWRECPLRSSARSPARGRRSWSG
jgi:DNA-binding MarR family transcriptional regulator